MHEEGCIKSPSERLHLRQKREEGCKAHGAERHMISRPCIQGFASLLCPALLLGIAFAAESEPRSSPGPGHGYPGRLETYDTTPELRRQMARFDLTAGWFRRAPINPDTYRYEPDRCPVNELPYLLFSPKHGKKPVPMVLYFGGTGEHGTNLVDQLW